MAREDLAWRMRVTLPTTTASSFLTGKRRGCWKRQGSTGQQREWKVIGKIILIKDAKRKAPYCLACRVMIII